MAILGGIVVRGRSVRPDGFFAWWLPVSMADTAGFLSSFLLITSLFILFSDLLPKRLGMAEPERLALRLHAPMLLCICLLRPLVWFYRC